MIGTLDTLGTPQLIVLLVAVLRVDELIYARRNTKRLLAEGGREVGARHYPLFILLHGGWLVALFVLTAPGQPILWPVLALFGLLQLGRLWVLTTLGRYWTTRIITVPNAPLITHGPYRFCRHPNYAIVIAEIATLPLAFGNWQLALGFSVLNLLLLGHRIQIEDSALAVRR